MNIKPILLSLAVFLLSSVTALVSAQEFTPYTWSESPGLTELSEEESGYPLYLIQKTEDYQYVYLEESEDLVCYETFHQIIRANNDDALNKSNKIYIPLKNAIQLVDLKARSISPDGKVTNFDQENLKELEDEESGYKILAIEGAETGGEIEYYYTLLVYNSSFKRRTIQSEYPIKNYGFKLRSPENLEYDFKVYNRKEQVQQTDTTDQYNEYALDITDVSGLNEEDFAAYGNSKIRLDYKLAYNTKSSNKRLNTWYDAGARVYEQICSLTKSEKSAVTKFLKKMEKSDDPLDNFRRAEHLIKSTFYFEEYVSDEAEQVDAILKNKYSSTRGYTRLYAEILSQLGLEYELVMTCDRMNAKFDWDFDTWNYLVEYLLYIPKTGQFMSPGGMTFRLGTIAPEYIGTEALFIRLEPVQDYIYPVAHRGEIGEPSYESNFDNMYLTVNFDENLESNQVHLKRDFKGYSASYYKAAWNFLEEDKKKEMIQQAIQYLATDAQIEKVEVKDPKSDYAQWDMPFTVEGTFSTSSYIENAGNTILFKVGELIGPQSELYQEKDRETEVVNDFNRGYLRKLSITIPEGYTVENPEDIIIEEVVNNGDKPIYLFVSKYNLEGQQLEIEIEEYYDQLYYPREQFEPFRKVINAAADWNKIVLVLSR